MYRVRGVVTALAVLVVAVVLSTSPAAALPSELEFKTMISTWSAADGLVKAPSSLLEIRVGGSVWASFHGAEGGMLDFSIPTAATSEWTLTVGNLAPRHFRAEFSDGLLYLKNGERDWSAADYHQNPDGSYYVEYWQDHLYICNQGQAAGPILGQIYIGGATLTSLSAPLAADEGSISAQSIDSPEIIGRGDTAFTGRAIRVRGGYAYVGSSRILTPRLGVFDISTPRRPRLVGRSDIIGRCAGLVIEGDYAYLAAKLGGLKIVDISDPTNPIRIGSAGGFSATSIAKDGKFAYLSTAASGFRIYRVSKPASPKLRGVAPSLFNCVGLAIRGNRLYVLRRNLFKSKLVVYNVSNPAAPVKKGAVVLPYTPRGNPVLSGNLAYIAPKTGQVMVIDISKPNKPKLAGLSNSSGKGRNLALFGSHLLLSSPNEGLVIFDISGPRKPVAKAASPAFNNWASDTAGTLAYASDNTWGLYVIDIGPAKPPSGGSEGGFGSGGGLSRQPTNGGNSGEIGGAIASGSGARQRRSLPAQLTGSWLEPNLAGAMNAEIPAMIMAWTYPDGRTDKWWLPIDGSGVLPNGISWSLTLGSNAQVSTLNLERDMPASFLATLAPGTHTVTYWLQDTDGAKSNKRWETLTIE